MVSYITRRKVGKTFQYFDGSVRIADTAQIERMNKLAIPPAWKNVEIAKKASTKVQARGVDKANRVQAIYSPEYRLKQEKAKFNRILRFADHLPALRKQVDKDLARKKLGKEKVLATIVRLIDEAYFRVGNERYAKEHQTYGITTLRSKHTNVTSNTITFDFVGKSGKRHVKKIKDSKIARIIKRLDELPGHEIFRYQDNEGVMHDLHSSDVNEYVKKHMGDEFTAKDFRTWGGTLLATSEVLADTLKEDASQTARKRAAAKIVKRVAKRLGNTPAVARSSYIDPRVLLAYEDNKTLTKLRKEIADIKPKKYRSTEEQGVLMLLKDD